MKKERIIRAWKDAAFRASLTLEERAELPENPSGEALAELDEDGLRQALGGHWRDVETAYHPCTLPAVACGPDF
ncbi:mersacidin/lichenicidin family type 2 lantibiotic [Archangium minus]|uniref:Mersacidin/lichenicidin family type 2 lantibiotic n=1 Tax=Archangium minus TaxID=83450 RepID=A0ABY9X9I0_9BACT|nr:mersacidin/lichenicidin family type 2 lantibiotic [Archangium minus]